jgi:hypothetical protein
MHPYSININDKAKVYWIIVPLSLLCGYLVNECILKNLTLYQTYSWIADIPSSGLGFFAIFYLLFDKYVWKLFSNNNFWFETPNISGEYEGELLSSRDDKQTPTIIEIKIKQTLTKIKISLHTKQSTSKSEMAALLVDEPDGPLLIYEFINDHRKVADPNLTIHRGLTRLTYNKKDKTLIGIYYTSPERKNYGEIHVKRK